MLRYSAHGSNEARTPIARVSFAHPSKPSRLPSLIYSSDLPEWATISVGQRELGLMGRTVEYVF